MNMYVTDINPRLCAEALDDKTLIEALGYATSSLSSACSLLGFWNASMHAAIRTAHPIPNWIAKTQNNFRWAYHYGMSLANEHRHRFLSEHSEEKFLRTVWKAFNDHPMRPLGRNMTPFVNLTPYSSDQQTHLNYRDMLCLRTWNASSQWTKRGRPDWYYPIKKEA